MGKYVRLDKLLCELGYGSRTDIKAAVRNGRVMVNGIVQKDSGIKVDPLSDNVFFDRKAVEYVQYEYILLNKPAGFISAVSDKKYKTVMDLVSSSRKDLFPVGRLDKDTEGLLLLTNDGALSHMLLSPVRHVKKIYYLETDVPIPADAVRQIAEGLSVDEEFTALPAVLEIISDKSARLCIYEGKFHQVKRMMKVFGCEVTYLNRVQMGDMVLDGLKTGEYRHLTDKEVSKLKEIDLNE